MCNCGNKRVGFDNSSNSKAGVRHTTRERVLPEITFVYTGNSALTVKGNITGRQYRFSKPGEKQRVDYRDASTIQRVPVLRRC